MNAIILDSTPLGLLTHRLDYPPAQECRRWMSKHVTAGASIFVPAIIAYEIRRELIRSRKTSSLHRLDEFIHAVPHRYLFLDDPQLHRAAELWAEIRQKGRPTADAKALDIDVILAAQALSLNLPTSEFVIATSNVAHFEHLAPAALWNTI